MREAALEVVVAAALLHLREEALVQIECCAAFSGKVPIWASIEPDDMEPIEALRAVILDAEALVGRPDDAHPGWLNAWLDGAAHLV